MTPRQQEVANLKNSGMSFKDIGAKLGISKAAAFRLNKRAQKYLNIDQGIKDAMSDTGLADIANVSSGWLKTDTASIRFTVDHGETVKASFIDDVREAFADMPCRSGLPVQDFEATGLCTFYNIVDHHLAMRSWGEETGQDYDLSRGIEVLTDAMGQLVASTPPSDHAVVLNLGDFFHMDDSNNQTPQSKHALDVDGRYFKVIQAGVALTCACIDMAAAKHRRVTYRALRGNHDIHAHVALTVALDHHYRDCDNVTIETNPSDFFVFEHGQNMICAHHGDKAKADRLVLHMADRYNEIWGRTHWRYMWTGHIHHDSAKEIGGVLWESFRTLAPKDAYAAGHAYSARQSMQAITLHETRGETLRNKVQIAQPG